MKNGDFLFNLEIKFKLDGCHLHRCNLDEVILLLMLPDFAWQAHHKWKENFVPWVNPGMHIQVC